MPRGLVLTPWTSSQFQKPCILDVVPVVVVVDVVAGVVGVVGMLVQSAFPVLQPIHMLLGSIRCDSRKHSRLPVR